MSPLQGLPLRNGRTEKRDNVLCSLPFILLIYRIRLPGPPMSKRSVIAELLAFDVLVGIGVKRTSEARNTRFDLAWVNSHLVVYLG